MHSLEIKPACKKSIKRYCKKNTVLKHAIEKKLSEIIESPDHYKSPIYKPFRSEDVKRK